MIDGDRPARLRGREFVKYHALGNDYLVVEPGLWPSAVTPAVVVALCHRHTGVGADGVLMLTPGDGAHAGHSQAAAQASLQIYNPDGSQAEKSGNGLRIFARALYDLGYITEPHLTVRLGAHLVHMQLHLNTTASGPQVAAITAGMGVPSFVSTALAMTGPPMDTTLMTLTVLGRPLEVTAVSMGNPHCVVFVNALSLEQLRRDGPAIECHPRFTERTNVQFARVRDRGNIELLIWERGAQETQASGSSSCAAVAAAQARGWVDADVTVHSPGGQLRVQRQADGALALTGPAAPVCRGFWLPA